jgi:hypothetical protein
MKPIIVTEELAVPGLKVVIRDTSEFKHQGMDKGEYLVGTIIPGHTSDKWTKVQWPDGTTNGYQVGHCDTYDLQVYVPEVKQEPEPVKSSVQDLRRALEESTKYVKEDNSDREFYEKRGYDMYGKSLKPNTNDTDYSGGILYLPSKNLTLKRGERPEGHRLKG